MKASDVPAPEQGSKDCVACQCLLQPGDTAFIAGLCFALQRNPVGILSALCRAHRVGLAAGHSRSVSVVPLPHRRQR